MIRGISPLRIDAQMNIIQFATLIQIVVGTQEGIPEMEKDIKGLNPRKEHCVYRGKFSVRVR